MDIEDCEASKTAKIKKKVVSLSDEAYDEIFNTVIHSAENIRINNDSSNDTDKNNSVSNETKTELIENKSITTSNKNHNSSNKNNTHVKKIIPKFSVPIKGNVSGNLSNKNQLKTSKKFVPPNIDNNIKLQHSQGNNFPLTTDQLVLMPETNSSLENKELNDVDECHDRTVNKEKQIKKKPITRNPLQNIAKGKSLLSKPHSLNTKKIKSKLNTIYKEADSTEKTYASDEDKTCRSTMINNVKGNETSDKTKFNRKKKLTSQSDIYFDSPEEEKEMERTSRSERICSNDVLQSFELSQASDGSVLINENSYTQLSQPSPELNQRQRLEWLRKRRDVGVWVQCCKIHCSKWRYLENVKDPVDIPEYWVCHMNNDARYNSCDKPERGPRLNEHIDLINNKYTAGSVVWAKLDGFPWWPALVDDDPDVEAYYWLNGFSDIPTHYHVVFFDDQGVSRAWATPGNMEPFTGTEKQKRFNTIYYRGLNYASRIKAAKEQAKLAYGMELKDRLEKYGFLARYNGPIGEKRTFKGKNQRKVSSDSDSVISTDTDDYNISRKRKKSRLTIRNKEKSKAEKVIKFNSKSNKAPKKSKITTSVIKKHKSHLQSIRGNAQNLKSKSNIQGKCISDSKDQEITSEKGSTQLNSQEMEISSQILSSQKHMKMYVPKAVDSSPTSHSKNITSCSNENIMQNSNRDDETDVSLLKDTVDVDPFEEESNSATENNLITHCESNAEHTEENVSCSNLATVGTFLGKQCNSIHVGQCNPINGTVELTSKQADLNNTEALADTSEDITVSLIKNNNSHSVPGFIFDSEQNSSDKLHKEVCSQNIQHSSNILCPVISKTSAIEGSEMVQNDSDSDPFEIED